MMGPDEDTSMVSPLEAWAEPLTLVKRRLEKRKARKDEEEDEDEDEDPVG